MRPTSPTKEPAHGGTGPSRIAVALGGGGARCLAQLGVLDELERAGVRPAAMAASSSAGFIAALWAAGHPPARIVRIVHEAVARLAFDLDGREGVLGHGGLARALAPHLPARFEDLPLPLAVVAIDAERAERVVLDAGPLLPALLATNAFPGLFAPVRLEGRLLIDGGAIEMVPVRTAHERWPEPVLAVDVGSPPNLELPNLEEALPAHLGRLAGLAARAAALGWTSYVVTQHEMVRYQLRVHPPAWRLRPPLRDDLGLFGFHRSGEAIAAGRRSARELLPALAVPLGT